MPTFAEMFCARRKLNDDQFVRTVFWRCLHRRALPVAPLLLLFNSEHFRPDFDLISSAGRLTSAAGIYDELADFYSDSRNYRFDRHHLKLRISGTRLRHLIFHEMGTPHSARGRPHGGQRS